MKSGLEQGSITRAIGGGLACYGAGSPLIADNLFLGNRLRLPGQGAGLFFDGASEARLVNNSMVNDRFMAVAPVAPSGVEERRRSDDLA